MLGTALAAGLIEFAAPGGIQALGLVKQVLGLLAWGYLSWVQWRTVPRTEPAVDPRIATDSDPALQP